MSVEPVQLDRAGDARAAEVARASTTRAWGAYGPSRPLEPMTVERRAVGPHDVRVAIDYCGICHTDLHTVRDDWGGTVYPVVPGHEIVGRVVEAGGAVSAHRTGDLVGVGCLVGSCGACEDCRAGLESYCKHGVVFTYDSADPIGPPARTFGGYAGEIVVDEAFALAMPAGLDPAAAAPLLCAGVTTYSPLRLHGAGPGSRVGVVGFGGLGNMAVRIAKALGAEVVVVTRAAKVEPARRAGADEAVTTDDAEAAARLARSLDLVLSCLPGDHDLDPYLRLLRRDGAYVIVGALEPLQGPLDARTIVGSRLHVTGSFIGGLPETREALEFCAAHQVLPDVEVVRPHEVNRAFQVLAAGGAGHRFVIDTSSLRTAEGDGGDGGADERAGRHP